MTEAEWMVCNDPEEMYFRAVRPLRSSRRRMDLFCLACVRSVLHLMEDESAKRAFAWLEEHPGHRCLPESGGHVRDLFQGPAVGLYEAHHRREGGVGGFAVHVAYDLWADWYEYAFPNLCELSTAYPGALREDPRAYLSAITRDIFGNPFHPATIAPGWLAWNDGAIRKMAQLVYDERTFDRLPLLADALEDAGCTDAAILGHCRGGGEHVRGCWVVDLLLGKS